MRDSNIYINNYIDNKNKNKNLNNYHSDFLLNLPTYISFSNTIDQCSICNEDHNNDTCILPCNHNFHRKCLTKWFIIKKQCPLCRKDYLKN